MSSKMTDEHVKRVVASLNTKLTTEQNIVIEQNWTPTSVVVTMRLSDDGQTVLAIEWMGQVLWNRNKDSLFGHCESTFYHVMKCRIEHHLDQLSQVVM